MWLCRIHCEELSKLRNTITQVFFLYFSYKIMQDCWKENPDDRPMFENLRNDLKEMENQHQVKYLQNKFKQGSLTFWCGSHLIDFLLIFFLAEAHQHATLWQHPLRKHGISSCSRILETTLITIGGNSFSHILFEKRLFKTRCVLVLNQVPLSIKLTTKKKYPAHKAR